MHPYARAQAALLDALANNVPVTGVSPRDAAPDLPAERPLLVDADGLDAEVELPTTATITDQTTARQPFVRFDDSGEPDMLLCRVMSPQGQVLGAVVANFDPDGTLTALHGMAA